MHRHIVIGPPGTGKTTYLKNKVQELIKSGACTSQQIGYFSFTVKAAEEIRDRVMDKEELSKEQMKIMFPYFSTLHSLAYRRLQLQQSQITDLNRHIERLDADIKRLTEDKEILLERLNDLSQSVAKKIDEIEEMEALLKDKDKIIEIMNMKVRDKQKKPVF